MSADGSVKQNGVGDQGRNNCTITGTGGSSSESVGLQGQFEADALVTSLPSAQFCSTTSLPSVHTVLHCLPLPVRALKSPSATENMASLRSKILILVIHKHLR